MPLTQVVVLAIVQGVTELLPISSTAHLIVIPWIFGWPDPGLTFDVALHVGTLLAVLLYFARLWIEIVFRNRRLFGYLVLATFPAGLAGLFLEHHVETTLRSPYVIAATTIGIALVMAWSERVARLRLDLPQVSLSDSMVIGVSQALAVVPGVSRSGITIAAGLFREMRRDTAARFSFLLATPIIAGAGMKKALELRHVGIAPEMRMPFLLGMLVAAVVGYGVITFFIRYLQTRTLKIFIYYRFVFGIIVLVLAILSRPR